MTSPLAGISGTSIANATIAATLMFGADNSGRSVMQFSLDGNLVTTVTPPDDIEFFQVTSVRWGKGPGFDPNSIYVTEGGGMLPTQSNRRVVSNPNARLILSFQHGSQGLFTYLELFTFKCTIELRNKLFFTIHYGMLNLP